MINLPVISSTRAIQHWRESIFFPTVVAVIFWRQNKHCVEWCRLSKYMEHLEFTRKSMLVIKILLNFIASWDSLRIQLQTLQSRYNSWVGSSRCSNLYAVVNCFKGLAGPSGPSMVQVKTQSNWTVIKQTVALGCMCRFSENTFSSGDAHLVSNPMVMLQCVLSCDMCSFY